MPEQPRALGWQRHALALEARLRELTGQAPERLDAEETRRAYPRRNYIATWRITVGFTDGVNRRMDVVATAGFPAVMVRTALVDRPEFMTWPHIERDGILCLLPNLAECDPDDPLQVAANILNRSVRLVEELIDGKIVERDFKEEFLTYWAYMAHTDCNRLFSLARPEPPSRPIAVWRGEGIELVGESAAAVIEWAKRRFGSGVKGKVETAALLWLGHPPLPGDYPKRGSDLAALAESIGAEAVEALRSAATSKPEALIALIGASGRGGPGLVAVRAPSESQRKARPGVVTDPLSRGFRPHRAAPAALAQRLFGPVNLIRSNVRRADAEWVHGRGRDPRAMALLRKSVVIIGCGSVGAPLACLLAQAGAGRIALVDFEKLEWPNIGRHPLGAASVGQGTAPALAARLQADYPHLQIKGREAGARGLIAIDGGLLEGADLIISATGSWAADSPLNRWHMDHGRARPILYAWTEAHALAGHGVVIAGRGGCLQCHIGRTGAPRSPVTEWPEGAETQEEPACGAHYQPYGPVELSFIVSMLGELALDSLLEPPVESLDRTFLRSAHRVEHLGGRLSASWLETFGDQDGPIITDRPWPTADCAACACAPQADAV